MGIMCVQEVKWKGLSARETGEGFKLLYIGGDTKRNYKLQVTLMKILMYSEIVNVVSGYAPQQGCSELEKKEFYETLKAS